MKIIITNFPAITVPETIRHSEENVHFGFCLIKDVAVPPCNSHFQIPFVFKILKIQLHFNKYSSVNVLFEYMQFYTL